MPCIEFDNAILIGANDQVAFWVGQLDGLWIGFALGSTGRGKMIRLFPEFAGFSEFGVRNKNEAIRLTAAVAQDPHTKLGGVTSWYVAKELRATPDDCRCEECGEYHLGEHLSEATFTAKG